MAKRETANAVILAALDDENWSKTKSINPYRQSMDANLNRSTPRYGGQQQLFRFWYRRGLQRLIAVSLAGGCWLVSGCQAPNLFTDGSWQLPAFGAKTVQPQEGDGSKATQAAPQKTSLFRPPSDFLAPDTQSSDASQTPRPATPLRPTSGATSAIASANIRLTSLQESTDDADTSSWPLADPAPPRTPIQSSRRRPQEDSSDTTRPAPAPQDPEPLSPLGTDDPQLPEIPDLVGEPLTPNAARGTPEAQAEAYFVGPLTQEQVLQSVVDCYPLIDEAFAEIEVAAGKVISSWGQFDRILSAHSISQPLSFYQNYRNGLTVTQPLYQGGEVYGAYRIGDGSFEPWFGERETNEAGEFKAGFSIPLLKDRDIDKRRGELLSSETRLQQTEANVQARLLMYRRFATQAYWEWVVAGKAVEVQKQLLNLALLRVDNIDTLIARGDEAEILRLDNNRFIGERKNDLAKAERKFQATAFKLSLFLRDPQCQPVIAGDALLPAEFPVANRLEDSELQAGVAQALSLRPELVELEAMRNEAAIALQLGENLTLPKLDVKGFAGQDIGGETSSKGDKTPFELQIGVFAEVPLQRREGLGKIQSAQSKIAQIDAKRQFTADKIRAEVIDAASAIEAAVVQIEQSTQNIELAEKALVAGRKLFLEGDINQIDLNIYERAVADAKLKLLTAELEYFFFRSLYQTAIVGEEF